MMHNNTPTESQEQQTLIEWVSFSCGKYPELSMLYHVPNEGLRNPRTGQRLKAEGMRPGVPDLVLPVARGGYHGLYIELKRVYGGRVSESQHAWLTALAEQGYKTAVCRGWEAARDMLIAYITEKDEQHEK